MDWKGLATMLTSIVSRCHTRGKYEDHTGKKACKGIQPGFETQIRYHKKSKMSTVSMTPLKKVAPHVYEKQILS